MKLHKTIARGLAAVAVTMTGLTATGAPAGADVVGRDPSFAEGDGAFTLDWDGGMDQARDVVVQPDGKILVAGWAEVSGDDDAELLRLNADGSPDTAFGEDGEYWYDGGSWDRFEAAAVMTDGDIVAVGTSAGQMLVVRLNADGTPDTGFSGDGVATPAWSSATDVVGVEDGKAVVYGDGGGDLVVMRLTAAGDLDPAFGTAGQTRADFGPTSNGSTWEANSGELTRLTDGAFMAAATRWTASFTGTPPSYSMVVRFKPDGTLDTSFNHIGYRFFDFDPQSSEQGLFVVPATSGKAVLGARTQGGTVLTRLHPGGGVDTSFGDSGFRKVDGVPGALARDNAGRLLVASSDIRRLTPSGHLDATFNKGSYRAGLGTPTGLAVQPDGRILHVGFDWVDAAAEDADWFVERLRFSPDPPAAGYWMLESNGAVYAFGDAPQFAYGHVAPGTRAVDIEPTPDGAGGWVVNTAGTVFNYGTAKHYGGNPALAPGEEVTSMSATKDGAGYWLFTSRGRAVTYGNAVHHGDMAGVVLNGPVLGSVRTASGLGYYMVASDGGIFSFGDADFHGSMGGTPLNGPVVGLASDPDNVGYWLVGSDGGVFAFDAPFRGSMGGTPLNKPVIGMVSYGNGYLMVGADGGIFSFSDKRFVGSLGSNPPSNPIVSVAAFPK